MLNVGQFAKIPFSSDGGRACGEADGRPVAAAYILSRKAGLLRTCNVCSCVRKALGGFEDDVSTSIDCRERTANKVSCYHHGQIVVVFGRKEK